MKKILLSLTLLTAATPGVFAQSGNNTFGQILNTVGSILNGSRDTNRGSGGYGSGVGSVFGGALSNADISRGLREALTVGTRNASNRLSAADGFFADAMIKILLPPEAQKVERTLRSIGAGSLVDKAVLQINRSAEDAAGKAVPIFVNAITSMSINDGLAILRGGNGAATQYLRSKTTASLTNAFRPVIQNSLNKTGATRVWGDVFNTYNRLPTTFTKVNPDLSAYVTERAMAGLFLKIADEETQIRTNPAARVSDILKKVFGSAQAR
jgi:hypothetical protein